MSIVRYWWTEDGDEEICSMKDSVAIGSERCYGHPQKSVEIVQKEVISCLREAGIQLSEDEVRRLLYYVEYHDYRMSHREKHLKKHLDMASLDEFKNLMLLQIADAKAHVLLPKVQERIRICEEWYLRVSNDV